MSALFTIVRMWKQPKYPSTKERKNVRDLYTPTKIKIASFAE